jgi:hypothetical protein
VRSSASSPRCGKEEAETIGDKVGGIAVSIGARIGGMAGPSEVLVSETAKDLVEVRDSTSRIAASTF